MNYDYDSKGMMKALAKIGDTPGTNDKLALLQAAVEQYGDKLKRVLLYAYSPFLRFNMRKLDVPPPVGKGDLTGTTFMMLNQLADRTLSGKSAAECVRAEFLHLNRLSQELFARILLKDLQIGLAETSINKVCKGLIPSMPYMRCVLTEKAKLDSWPWGRGAFSQVKEDGLFVNVNVSDNAEVELLSRTGRPFPTDSFASLVMSCKTMLAPGTQTHGELLVVDNLGKTLPRKKGNGLLNSITQGGAWPKGHRPILRVWDQIPLDQAVPKGRVDTPYSKRYFSLLEQVSRSVQVEGVPSTISMIETRIVYSKTEAYQHCAQVIQGGEEGTIVKHPDMPWRDTDSGEPFQVKLKVEAECDLRMVRLVPGDARGKHAKTFGSIECHSECGKLVTNVAGFTDKMRADIHASWERDYKDRIMEVTFNDIMVSDNGKPHSLFLPRYSKMKPATQADTFERIQSAFASVIGTDKTVKECQAKFNKTLNYGGTPRIPGKRILRTRKKS